MFANVYTKTLHDLRKGIIGWSIGLVGLIGIMVSIWPTVRDMPNMDEFLAQYPEAMRELFNIEQFATGPGYLNAELFASMLPVIFIAYSIGVGARLLAREEEQGTLDVLLSTPLSRSDLLLHKAAAMATAIVTLGVVVFLSTWVLSTIAAMEASVGYVAGASLAMILIGLVHGAIAFAIGAVTGSRGRAIAITASVAVAAYALYIVAALVDSVDPWKVLTPFHHAIGVGAAATGGPDLALGYVWLALATLAFVALVRPLFHSRDLGV